MSRNIKLFLIVFLVSIPFWLLVNVFGQWAEDVFYAAEMQKNKSLFTAQIAPIQANNKTRARLQEIGPGLTAGSILVAEIKRGGGRQVIFEKNPHQARPIASLAKLMTAVVAEEFYPDDLHITISEKAVEQMEDTGSLRPGETLRLQDLLYIMLIESSNDAAFAIADAMDALAFVALMNLKAQELGLDQTRFSNPMGLDPEDVSTDISKTSPTLSSADDLARLAQYIITTHSSILDILSKKQDRLYLENGVFHHTLINSNELLGVVPEIIGGKTGYTSKAGGCLLTIAQGKRRGEFLITIVLGSEHRFEETKKILEAYYR